MWTPRHPFALASRTFFFCYSSCFLSLCGPNDRLFTFAFSPVGKPWRPTTRCDLDAPIYRRDIPISPFFFRMLLVVSSIATFLYHVLESDNAPGHFMLVRLWPLPVPPRRRLPFGVSCCRIQSNLMMSSHHIAWFSLRAFLCSTFLRERYFSSVSPVQWFPRRAWPSAYYFLCVRNMFWLGSVRHFLGSVQATLRCVFRMSGLCSTPPGAVHGACGFFGSHHQ